MAENNVGFSVVVIGGSAGSLDVIMKMTRHLSPEINAAYIIIVHRKNAADSMLTGLLAARTALPVKEVEDKEALLPGTVYIAPPDYHLLIEDEKSFSLDSSEKVNHSRPSIDVTFESAALVFGHAAIGVLLSGANADGAEGLQKIKNAGGYVIVQDPDTAEVSFMPQQAIKLGNIDAVVTGDELGEKLFQLLQSIAIKEG
jgi:two-component system, chemotaxis family, protein-glutamate methylesterase/glutaminase